MLKPTKIHRSDTPDHSGVPTVRIGRKVPANAVNLAYYYNPSANGTERILSADAPKNTIDHMVQDTYRYLFEQAERNDDLFPGYIDYLDQDGYIGKLSRMYVNWYEKAHTATKIITGTQTIHGLLDKKEIPKTMTYPTDSDGFSGTMYFDVADYSVASYTNQVSTEQVEYSVRDFELNYSKIYHHPINTDDVDDWMSLTDSDWPKTLEVIDGQINTASIEDPDLKNYLGCIQEAFDNSSGTITLSKTEHEPISSVEGTSVTTTRKNNAFTCRTEKYRTAPTIASLTNTFKESYQTSNGNQQNIQAFLTFIENYGYSASNRSYKKLKDIIHSDNKRDYDIYIYRSYINVSGDSDNGYYGTAKYSYTITQRGVEGNKLYNVNACYTGTLYRTIKTDKQVPQSYDAVCTYEGVARKITYTYDGMAYYRGSVVKGNAIGNINPENGNELLMFPDDDGYLHTTDGIEVIETQQIEITDVFKDGVPCFYKTILRSSLYDYRGPDVYGFYQGNSVVLQTKNRKEIPSSYHYQMKLVPDEYETYEERNPDGSTTAKQRVKSYRVHLYTSFLSSAGQGFCAVYHSCEESDLKKLKIEDFYNYPFYQNGTDYVLQSVDEKARTSRIKLTRPNIIPDTRRYVTFSYRIKAKQAQTGRMYESLERSASILNRHYAADCELGNYIGRNMKISPKNQGIFLSPKDVMIQDMSAMGTPVTEAEMTQCIFFAEITKINSEHIGAVNITCNTDGSGILLAETTLETGFYDEQRGTYTRKLSNDCPYEVRNGKIYFGYQVKCKDVRSIKILAPYGTGLLEGWYPRIQFGHFSMVMQQAGNKTKVCYSMPEYDAQHFDQKPYRKHEESVKYINGHTIQLSRYPLLWNDTKTFITVYKWFDGSKYPLTVSDCSYSDGVVFLKENISKNDDIRAEYWYFEESYEYRGYLRSPSDYCRIDLNPNQYHTYSDLAFVPSKTTKTLNLFNHVIYFFLRPSIIYVDSNDDNSYLTIQETNDITLYHQIGNPEPESETDLYIGSVYIRSDTSFESTVVIDTRVRGGGLIESMKDSLRHELEPESDWYLDIGYYDGKPYQQNGTVLVRLDERLLKEHGGQFTKEDVYERVKRWMAFGLYPIIEYVKVFEPHEMPQYSLVMEQTYTNVEDDMVPTLTIELEE